MERQDPSKLLVHSVRPVRLVCALCIASIADALSIALAPVWPATLVLDVITVILLLVAVGWRWPIAIAFILETIPGVEVFPSWILVIAWLAFGTSRPKQAGDATLTATGVNRTLAAWSRPAPGDKGPP